MPKDAPKTHDASVKKLAELLKEFRIAMMTTFDPAVGGLRARPMAPQNEPFDGKLYFFIDKDSHKVEELEQNPSVCLAYAGDSTYVSVTGTGRVTRDKAEMKRRYHADVEAWFPKGLDDPCIALMIVDVEAAEYWEGPPSTVMQVLAFAKAKLTGERLDAGENEKVDL